MHKTLKNLTNEITAAEALVQEFDSCDNARREIIRVYEAQEQLDRLQGWEVALETSPDLTCREYDNYKAGRHYARLVFVCRQLRPLVLA